MKPTSSGGPAPPLPIEFHPVGTVVRAGEEAEIQIEPRYEPALHGMEPGHDYWILYWMHQLGPEHRQVLQTHPMGDRTRPVRGVFALRSPRRPNPVGLTRVTLTRRQGTTLFVTGLDAKQGSPVLDVKLCLESAR